jgi:hypothetical protein
MGPTGKSIVTLLVATMFACGAVLSTAIATTTDTATTTAKPGTPAKKKSVVHKPVPRPNPPEAPTTPASKSANGSQGVSLGVPTASRKALGIPLPRTIAAQPPRQAVAFGHAPSVGAGHGLGTATVHVAQSNLHLELKP